MAKTGKTQRYTAGKIKSSGNGRALGRVEERKGSGLMSRFLACPQDGG